MADISTITDNGTCIDEFREHRQTLYLIARRYVGEDSANDVLQNVFVRIWSHPARYDESRGSARQYLCTLTRGMSIDHLRHVNAQRSRDDRTNGHRGAFSGEDTLQQLIDRDAIAAVQAALASIPAQERLVIVTAFYGGLTYREVAIELGIPEGTAKSRIRSGLRSLHRRLELSAAASP